MLIKCSKLTLSEISHADIISIDIIQQGRHTLCAPPLQIHTFSSIMRKHQKKIQREEHSTKYLTTIFQKYQPRKTEKLSQTRRDMEKNKYSMVSRAEVRKDMSRKKRNSNIVCSKSTFFSSDKCTVIRVKC